LRVANAIAEETENQKTSALVDGKSKDSTDKDVLSVKK
jgi:hypothetical protein